MNLKRYSKFLVAAAAVAAAVGKALADGSLSADDIQVVVGAALAAAGVWAVPNKTA